MNDANDDDALKGAGALAELRRRDVGVAAPDLYHRLKKQAGVNTGAAAKWSGFWGGAGFGVALAASILAVAVTLGWLSPAGPGDDRAEVFELALNELRLMDVAIETEAPLENATISIQLSGEVLLDGFGDRRELSWSDNLDAGVNRLSLPLVATGPGGGQLVVRLNHPKSEKTWVIDLDAGA